MEALYIILGAVLALGGGVLTHHVQLHYARAKEEALILFDVQRTLIEIGVLISQMNRIPADSEKVEDLAKLSSLNFERLSQIEKLSLFALRITSDKNRKVAVRITKFALDKHFQTEQIRMELLEEVQVLLNSKLINQYIKEMDQDPSVF